MLAFVLQEVQRVAVRGALTMVGRPASTCQNSKRVTWARTVGVTIGAAAGSGEERAIEFEQHMRLMKRFRASQVLPGPLMDEVDREYHCRLSLSEAEDLEALGGCAFRQPVRAKEVRLYPHLFATRSFCYARGL